MSKIIKMTKIFDIQKTIVAANGNISLAKELFTMLLEELDSRLQQIETSFQSGDMDILAEHAHKLFGATAYCIVPELREATKILDKALREKNYSILNELVKDVAHEMKQLMSEGPLFLEQEWTKT